MSAIACAVVWAGSDGHEHRCAMQDGELSRSSGEPHVWHECACGADVDVSA